MLYYLNSFNALSPGLNLLITLSLADSKCSPSLTAFPLFSTFFSFFFFDLGDPEGDLIFYGSPDELDLRDLLALIALIGLEILLLLGLNPLRGIGLKICENPH